MYIDQLFKYNSSKRLTFCVTFTWMIDFVWHSPRLSTCFVAFIAVINFVCDIRLDDQLNVWHSIRWTFVDGIHAKDRFCVWNSSRWSCLHLTFIQMIIFMCDIQPEDQFCWSHSSKGPSLRVGFIKRIALVCDIHPDDSLHLWHSTKMIIFARIPELLPRSSCTQTQDQQEKCAIFVLDYTCTCEIIVGQHVRVIVKIIPMSEITCVHHNAGNIHEDDLTCIVWDSLPLTSSVT